MATYLTEGYTMRVSHQSNSAIASIIPKRTGYKTYNHCVPMNSFSTLLPIQNAGFRKKRYALSNHSNSVLITAH
ncbi:hypothetical protein ACTXT7_003257 [Hymenolepis weldensis]